MKLKGKALLSLLCVLTLVLQLFSVSASAAYSESLNWDYEAVDLYGQQADVPELGYAVQVGGQISDLMFSGLSVNPPSGWAVEKAWINAGDGAESVALPLTAAADGSAKVSVKPEAFILRYDSGSPVFDESLLSSLGGAYTLHVRFAQVDPDAAVEISDSWGNVIGSGAVTAPGDPGSDGSSQFVGWRLSYPNGASVLLQPGTTVYPYASATLEAAYAALVVLHPSDVSATAGDSLYNVLANVNVEQINLPYDLSVAGIQVTSNAPDPLQEGTYSLSVNGRLVDFNGKDVDPTVAVLSTQEGVLSVAGGYVPEPEPIVPEPAQPTAVTVTLYDQRGTAGTGFQLDSTQYGLDPWADIVVGIYAMDAYGNMIDPASAPAGTYTLTADLYYDTTLYAANLIPATLTIDAPVVHTHTAGEPVRENVVDPTCTAGGSYDSVVYCVECGEQLSRDTVYTDPLGHTPGEAAQENLVPATCTADGSYLSVVRCTVCGEVISSETVVIPATGHTAGEPVQENVVPATCEAGGSYDNVVTCTVCGEVISRETVVTEALGHNWGEWTVTTPATEEAEGVETRVCLNDSTHVETRPIDKLAHTHDLVKTERKEATYTEPGNIEYYTCQKCGKLYRDAEATEEITLEDTVLPVLETIEATVTVSSQSWTVGSGTQLDLTAFQADGFEEGDPYTVTLRAVNYSDAVGEYVITADVTGYDEAKYRVTVQDGTLTVTPPDIVNVTVNLLDQSLSYNGKAQNVDSALNTAYTVTGLAAGDELTVNVAALGADGSRMSSVTNAGSYTLQASISGYDTAKYNVTVANTAKLTVSPYAVIAVADSASKTYDGKPLVNNNVTAPLLEGHKFRDGDGVSIAIYDSNNVLRSDGAVAVGVYTKKITAVHIVDAQNNEVTANYALTYADGTLTILAPDVTPSPSPTPTPTPSAEPTPSPVIYPFIDNYNGYQWVRGSSEGLVLKVNADIRKFVGVKIDGAEIPENCYIVSSGSTVVTLKSEYLKNLTAANHAITVEFSDGSAATTFTITAPPATPDPLPVEFRNVAKAYDGTAYNMASYIPASSGIVAQFHMTQNGQTVAQAVEPGTYDIVLDSLSVPAYSGRPLSIRDSSGQVLSTNYTGGSLRVASLTITGTNVSNVTVNVNDQSWTYDGTAHTLNAAAYSVSGLQGSDTITVKLSIVDANGRTLTSVTDAGTYTIKADCSGYSSARYNVTVAKTGTLTVSPYKLTLTAESAVKNYDGSPLRNSNVKATALCSGHKFRASDGVKFSVYDSKGNLIQNGPVAVGTYTKKVTDVHIVDANNIEVTANYDITRIDGTLTINNSDGSPKTGDTNNLTLWIVLLAVSALLILAVATLFLRRSKKRSKAAAKATKKAAAKDDIPQGKH